MTANSSLTNTASQLVNSMMRLNIGDELLWAPERLVQFEHWVGHIPFAFWLVKTLRPRRLVELGTHRGNSYSAFCQAITALHIDCQAVAIDTWEGDIHMPHEEGLLEELKQHHDPRYDSFSTLMQMTFDEARPHIPSGAVDLLHIDGAHTYDAVKHDFETWRDSLSTRGVVLFHDISVHREPYGVWRLWSELVDNYPSFTFTHSFGLGVLAVGKDLPVEVRGLFDIAEDPEAALRVKTLFEARGQGLISRLKAEQTETVRARLASDIEIASQRETIERERAAAYMAEAEAQRAEAIRAREELQLFQSGDRTQLINTPTESDDHALELEALRTQAARLSKELDTSRRECKALEHACEKSEQAVKFSASEQRRIETALTQTRDAQNSELAHARHLRGIIEELRGIIEEREKQRVALGQELDSANSKISSLLASTSWRVTRPLRFARRGFRRAQHT